MVTGHMRQNSCRWIAQTLSAWLSGLTSPFKKIRRSLSTEALKIKHSQTIDFQNLDQVVCPLDSGFCDDASDIEMPISALNLNNVAIADRNC
ncbi:hypothetical protein GCM10007891_04830 [Methylophaga thalassica]|uniref:Uncharacterized protein n=1 Tax=Methylophaga thalassica TaxID=40223 RepID=A0ABQ5TSW2_9GAMM|nr:hypothetical protein GCM10007891_04830 [Methylophaga thalassica]